MSKIDFASLPAGYIDNNMFVLEIVRMTQSVVRIRTEQNRQFIRLIHKYIILNVKHVTYLEHITKF
jgi:hypothetical protein